MISVSMFGALFTWLMIFVTHLFFRRKHPAPTAFRMWGYPYTSAAGATLMLQGEGREQPASLVLAYGVFHGTLPEHAEVEKSLRGSLAGSNFMLAEVHRMTRNYVGDERLMEHPLAFPAYASLSTSAPSASAWPPATATA